MVAAGVPWTHGAYVGGQETSEHAIWRGMLARCRNSGAKDYDRYGGRGIVVCERWLTFENFLADMGPRPSTSHSVERLDNDGPYAPGNCCWATHEEQQRNKRGLSWWQEGDVVDTMAGWARRLGISKELAHWRMSSWGTFERGRSWQHLKQK